MISGSNYLVLWVDEIDEEVFSAEEEPEDSGDSGAWFSSSPLWRGAPSC